MASYNPQLNLQKKFIPVPTAAEIKAALEARARELEAKAAKVSAAGNRDVAVSLTNQAEIGRAHV